MDEFSNTTFFSDANLKLSTALLMDALNTFAETVYNYRMVIETSSIDCLKNDNWEHGLSLFNIIRTVKLAKRSSKSFSSPFF